MGRTITLKPVPRPKTGPHAQKCWKQGHGPLSSLAHCGFKKGHSGPHAWAHLDKGPEPQIKLWAGLGVSVTTALLASSDLLPDGKWRHMIGIVGIVATGVNGYFLQRHNKR